MTTASGQRVTRSLLKWLLGLLVVANLAVWVAWFWRDSLVEMGVLAPPPVQRLDLDPEPLPPLVGLEAEQRAVGVEPGLPPAAPDPESVATPQVETSLPPTESETAPARLACVVAGPFASREAADQVEQRLRASGATVELLEPEITPSGYQVYVEPEASQDAAWLVLRELRAQSVEDAYVIASGALENGVSIGFFTDERRALTRRDQVAALGYTVSIQTREEVSYRARVRDVLLDALAELAHVPCEGENGVEGVAREEGEEAR